MILIDAKDKGMPYMFCEECKQEVPTVVSIGITPNEDVAAYICESCIKQAVKLFEESHNERQT
jgi:protein-arginine kinase activator protein McsA